MGHEVVRGVSRPRGRIPLDENSNPASCSLTAAFHSGPCTCPSAACPIARSRLRACAQRDTMPVAQAQPREAPRTLPWSTDVQCRKRAFVDPVPHRLLVELVRGDLGDRSELLAGRAHQMTLSARRHLGRERGSTRHQAWLDSARAVQSPSIQSSPPTLRPSFEEAPPIAYASARL